MATGSSSLYLGSDDCGIECDVCKYQDITSQAVSYCQICTEALCQMCDKVHRASKQTRSHTLKTGDDMLTITTGSQRTPSVMTCNQHQMVIKYFCSNHNNVLCNTCKITSHSICVTSEIDASTDMVNSGQLIGYVHDKLEALEERFNELKTKRVQEKHVFKKNIENCFDEIKKIRIEVNDVLDKLEKKMKAEVTEMEKNINKEIDEHLNIAGDNIGKIQESLKRLKECEKTRQDDIMFVGMKKAEEQIVDYEKISTHLETHTSDIDIHLKPDDLLTTTLKRLQSFGKLQTRVQNRNDISFLNLTLSDKRYHNVGCVKVQSIVFLPDGHAILACVDDGLRLLDKDFRLKSQLAIRAIHTCQVSNTEVLVALGRLAKLHFVTVVPNMVIKATIDVGKHCPAVDFFNGMIYVTCHFDIGNWEIQILNRNGVLQRRLGVGKKQLFNFPNDIKVTGDYVLVAERYNNAVTCLDHQGQVIYRYKDKHLKEPSGLLTDDDNNFMVCGDNVHVVSKEGNKHRIMLTKTDGIKLPICLSYRRSDKCLAVGMCNKDNISLCTFVMKS